MKKINYISYSFLLLILSVVTACESDSKEPSPVPVEEEAPGYLELAVSTAGNPGSRANPTPGEDGDGHEHGRENENSIYDLSIFLYVGENGLDGDYDFQWKKFVYSQIIEQDKPSASIDRIYYVRIPLTKEEVETLEGITGAMRLAVIANAGDITANHNNTTQLVRNITCSAWAGETAANADRFLMAPAYNGAKATGAGKNDGEVTKTTASDGSTVFSATVNLERVAARIDLGVTTDNIKEVDGEKVLRYNVIGSDNYLTLKNAIPVNLMQQSSYLVKHVAANIEDTWLAAGDETVTDGYPSNYVITPLFSEKGKNNDNLNGWYGTSRADWLRNGGRNSLPGMFSLSADVVGSAYKFDDATEKERAIILTYANENTHPEELQLTHEREGVKCRPSDYLTGLLFRAQYHPAVVYSDGACSEPVNYQDGQTFWMFRNVASEVKEENNLYFASKEALDDYVATLPAGGKYETQMYNGGICYYNIWIKHGNVEADPEENFPMKYGIVRNNIYRISLNFHGIGQPTPDIHEPYAITSRVFVIKWNFRPQPEIIM